LKKIICLTGMPGAGKSVFSEVARGLGLRVVVMGDVVRDEALKRQLTPTQETLGKLMVEMRRTFGSAVIAERCFHEVDATEGPVVIEGVRSLAELRAFRKRYGSVWVVAVHSSARSRFKRLKERGRPDDPKTWREFNLRDMRELRVGIGNVIALADFVLVNEGSITRFKRKAEDLLTALLKPPLK